MRTFGYARAEGSRSVGDAKVRAKRQFPHITCSQTLQGDDIDTLQLRRCGVPTARCHGVAGVESNHDAAPARALRTDGRRNETSARLEEQRFQAKANARHCISRINEGVSSEAIFMGATDGPSPRAAGKATFPHREPAEPPLRPIRATGSGATSASMGNL